jgi:hypothetical protein
VLVAFQSFARKSTKRRGKLAAGSGIVNEKTSIPTDQAYQLRRKVYREQRRTPKPVRALAWEFGAVKAVI